MTSLAGRHIWIIGASSGIGHALAMQLAAEGAHLTLSARNAPALEQLNVDLGNKHIVLPLNITDAAALIDAADQQTHIESLIILAGQYEPGAIADITDAAARHIIETNFIGTLNAVRAVLPVFRRQRQGQIALCASIAGYRGLPNGQPYSATKAAIINFAESLRVEEEKNGIDVRLINPGFVKTPMTDKNKFPMPMMITPEQAAKAIVAGLKGNSFEISFPKRMILPMKILQILPYWLYFKIAKRL